MNGKSMTRLQVIRKLVEYNQWRRGGSGPMPSPKEIGKTIDEAIRLLKKSE